MSSSKDFKIENGILKKCFCNVKEITVPSGIISISSYAFAHCTKLEKITIPQGVKRICIGAFRHCYRLEEIILPDGVETIGKWAFQNCYSLKKIVIPGSVTQIGQQAFFRRLQLSSCCFACDSQSPEQAKMILSAVTFSNVWLPFLKGMVQTNAALEQILIKKITSKTVRIRKIPLLMQSEDIEAFKRLFSLLDNAKLSTEELDFYVDCSIGKVEFTNYLIGFRNQRYPIEKVLAMQREDMEKTLGLREKTLTDYRKEFTIVKKDGLCTITKYKGVAPAVVVPGAIQGVPVTVKKYAFLGCSQVEHLYMEEGITHLKDGAFAFCRRLQRVEIPHSVIEIEPLCFDGCYQLNEIHYHGTKEEWYQISAIRYRSNCDIFCTDGKIMFYA